MLLKIHLAKSILVTGNHTNFDFKRWRFLVIGRERNIIKGVEWLEELLHTTGEFSICMSESNNKKSAAGVNTGRLGTSL